jgi:hypothetical protein
LLAAVALFCAIPCARADHGLIGMDLETLAWIERNPAALRAIGTRPGAAAVFAGAIRIRGDTIETPGEDASEVWTALVSADPAQPAVFIEHLLAGSGGVLAAFYDTIARLDRGRQACAIGRRGDPGRVERARPVFAATDGRDVRPLASSLAAVVYACALGEADGAAQNAGTVWRRHQFRGRLAAQGGTSSPWRLAMEVFGSSGWHLAGSHSRRGAGPRLLGPRPPGLSDQPARSTVNSRA